MQMPHAIHGRSAHHVQVHQVAVIGNQIVQLAADRNQPVSCRCSISRPPFSTVPDISIGLYMLLAYAFASEFHHLLPR